MVWIDLIISIISGIIGGNLAGKTLGRRSLGWIGNSFGGFFGGVIAGYILQAFGFSAVNTTIPIVKSIIANIIIGGLCGAILTLLIDYVISATSPD